MNFATERLPIDFSTVTEIGGAQASLEQIARSVQRYYWAGEYCRGKDVLEVACGAGQGLGYLNSAARTLHGGDITPTLVREAQSHYGPRIPISEMDAQNLPFKERSLDVVVLFEALYYLPSAEKFVAECVRVLRPDGRVLIATANKGLYDFNPSPHSTTYYGVPELGQLFGQQGFSCEFFGDSPIAAISLRQRLLRPVKKIAVNLNLVPGTMKGKILLKRIVFGKLHPLPKEITADTAARVPPIPIKPGEPNRDFKIIYLAATLTHQSS